MTTSLLNQWKKWAANEELLKAIEQSILYFITTESAINKKLTDLKTDYLNLANTYSKGGLIDGISFHDYGFLAQRYFSILAGIEKYTDNQPKKAPLFLRTEFHTTNIIAKDSYALLKNALLHLTALFLLPILCFLGSVVFLSNPYFDQNWNKAYLLFSTTLFLYILLLVCANWMKYFIKFDYNFRKELIDEDGKVTRTFSNKAVSEKPLIQTTTISNNWENLKLLIFSGSQPNWIVHSKYSKRYWPIFEGLKLFFLPCFLAFLFLLCFQSYLNYSFPPLDDLNTIDNLNTLKSRIGFLKIYTSFSNWKFTVFNKPYYLYQLGLWVMTILVFIGSFFHKWISQLNSKEQNSNKEQKEKEHRKRELIRKINQPILAVYYFLVVLSTFTYGSSINHQSLKEKGEEVETQIEFLPKYLNFFVSYTDNKLREQRIIENLLANEPFEKLLKIVEKHKNTDREYIDKIDSLVREINRVMNWKKENLITPVIHEKLFPYEQIFQEIETQLEYFSIDKPPTPSPDDKGPDDKGPDDKGPDDKGPDDKGPDDKGPKKYNKPTFSSKKAEKIWKAEKDKLTVEGINEAKDQVDEQFEKWKEHTRKKVTNKSSLLINFLKPYLGSNRSLLGLKMATKYITKECFLSIAAIFGDNLFAKAILRAVYGEAFDPKVDAWIEQQITAIIKHKSTVIPQPTQQPTSLDELIKNIEEDINNYNESYEKPFIELNNKLTEEKENLQKEKRKKLLRLQNNFEEEFKLLEKEGITSSLSKDYKFAIKQKNKVRDKIKITSDYIHQTQVARYENYLKKLNKKAITLEKELITNPLSTNKKINEIRNGVNEFQKKYKSEIKNKSIEEQIKITKNYLNQNQICYFYCPTVCKHCNCLLTTPCKG